MEDIKFKCSELLDIIKKNRDAHRAEFEVAIAGYEAEAMKRLKQLVKEMNEGKRPQLMVNLVIPTDHTKDYDRIIRMMEMSQDDTIPLSEHDFAQYVQDDWAWKHQFHMNTSGYMVAGAAALKKKSK